MVGMYSGGDIFRPRGIQRHPTNLSPDSCCQHMIISEIYTCILSRDARPRSLVGSCCRVVDCVRCDARRHNVKQETRIDDQPELQEFVIEEIREKNKYEEIVVY